MWPNLWLLLQMSQTWKNSLHSSLLFVLLISISLLIFWVSHLLSSVRQNMEVLDYNGILLPRYFSLFLNSFEFMFLFDMIQIWYTFQNSSFINHGFCHPTLSSVTWTGWRRRPKCASGRTQQGRARLTGRWPQRANRAPAVGGLCSRPRERNEMGPHTTTRACGGGLMAGSLQTCCLILF